MCFYVNEAHQATTPQPSEEGVYLEERPEFTAIVSREGGFMSEEDWQALAMKLKEDATKNGETGVDYSFYYRYTGTGASPRIFEWGGGQAWAHQTYPKIKNSPDMVDFFS